MDAERHYLLCSLMPGFRNLGLVIQRSEDILSFILGLSFGVLAMLSTLGITIIGITRQCL